MVLNKHRKILNIISSIRESHSKMGDIFSYGSCLNLFIILRNIFPEAKPYFNIDHIITIKSQRKPTCFNRGMNLVNFKINTFGDINKNLQLSDRNWTCKNGHYLDRDLNAAINIKNFGLRALTLNVKTDR